MTTSVNDHLGQMLRDSVRTFASYPAMRYEHDSAWQSISYEELGVRVRATAQALVESGVSVGDRVGIFSANCPEWTIADFAILSVGAVSVPIYATSTAKQAEYVMNDAGISVAFVGDQVQLDKVVSARSRTPQLQRVIVFDRRTTLDGDMSGSSSEYFDAFHERGSRSTWGDEVDARFDAVTGDDMATLIYTSGTTGDPKGVVLTHSNFFHQIRALDERFGVGPGDASLCFLPLSHVYERAWSFYVYAKGAENCYLLDPRRVADAMVEVRPSLMVSVPRLYEKVHASVLDRVERGPTLKAAIFRWSVRVGATYQQCLRNGRAIGPLRRAEHAVADRLVLSRIRDAVGGDKKVFSAGGAPLSPEIEEFFLATGILVCQGYGLTETTAMVTCNYPGSFRFGTVGTPVGGTEVRIASGGEIQVRGGNVMKGYFGKPDETAAAFDNGWFKTGDVGEVDADGFLRVTDRIKDIIITAQGKNVAPQHVEGVLGNDPYIDQVVVLGDRRSFLSALIAPTFPLLERYAHEHGIAYDSHADLVARPEVRALYDEHIKELSAELAGYEQVKRYTLVSKEFTQEGGQLTPTLKVKRRVIEQQFRDVIDKMYDEPRRT
ncbi:MAG: long-chain fatty acid--CoA ligase [Actinomycetes bacterium]